MRLLWRTRSNPLTWWWVFLTLVSSANIAIWFLLYHWFYGQPVAGQVSDHVSDHASDLKLMLLLCAAYVFGCAFRSVLPRADVQRICLFDHWLCSVFVGRSVATVAEICFVAQWAIILTQLGSLVNAETTLNVAWVIVPLIVIAECFSWHAVLTTNFLGNAIENSIWAVVFVVVGVALGRLLPEFHGAVRWVLIGALAGIVFYVAFLVTVDVPMYLGRWKASLVEGSKVLGLLEGLRDARTRWVVSHDITHWKDEIPWMSLYFSAAVWASLALCAAYSLDEYLPRYRTEPAAISWSQPSASSGSSLFSALRW